MPSVGWTPDYEQLAQRSLSCSSNLLPATGYLHQLQATNQSCVKLAEGRWTNKYQLEAALIMAVAAVSLELTGNGVVLEVVTTSSEWEQEPVRLW
jgi:hypothetical protein